MEIIISGAVITGDKAGAVALMERWHAIAGRM